MSWSWCQTNSTSGLIQGEYLFTIPGIDAPVEGVFLTINERAADQATKDAFNLVMEAMNTSHRQSDFIETIQGLGAVLWSCKWFSTVWVSVTETWEGWIFNINMDDEPIFHQKVLIGVPPLRLAHNFGLPASLYALGYAMIIRPLGSESWYCHPQSSKYSFTTRSCNFVKWKSIGLRSLVGHSEMLLHNVDP